VGTKKLLIAFHVVIQVSERFLNKFGPASNAVTVQTKGCFVTTSQKANRLPL
jgi:hypothetical protein